MRTENRQKWEFLDRMPWLQHQLVDVFQGLLEVCWHLFEGIELESPPKTGRSLCRSRNKILHFYPKESLKCLKFLEKALKNLEISKEKS